MLSACGSGPLCIALCISLFHHSTRYGQPEEHEPRHLLGMA